MDQALLAMAIISVLLYAFIVAFGPHEVMTPSRDKDQK